MPDKFTSMTAELQRYAIAHSDGHDEVLRELAAETEKLGDIAVMQTAPEQGSLITLLVTSLRATRALEVGTFTGYSAICIARGLADGGTLVACDVSDEWTAIGRRYFERAGVADKIDLRIGPALETLRAMDEDETFDFAFIDADKTGYPDYYEEVVRLLRPGGMVMVDNVFMGGEVVDSDADREGVVAMRLVSDLIVADDRVLSVMLGVADGITLALKL